MARLLVIGAISWPLVLGLAVWTRHTGRAPFYTAVVYTAASRVCHQRPDRSFFTAGTRWPVCGRCAGLYLAAPWGALWALRRRRGRARPWDAKSLVALASLPTLVTLLVEWPGLAAPTNLMRAAAAVPLGSAIAWVLVRQTLIASDQQPVPIQVN